MSKDHRDLWDRRVWLALPGRREALARWVRRALGRSEPKVRLVRLDPPEGGVLLVPRGAEDHEDPPALRGRGDRLA